MNDYELLVERIREAENATDTALSDAQDADTAMLLDTALVKLREARAQAEARA